MKAIVRDKLAVLPDHSPQSGRLLVRTHVSARLVRAPSGRSVVASSYRLMRERTNRVRAVLRHDGIRILFGKASHLIRRDIQSSSVRCASFVGYVVGDGSRVAGISVTHPPDTEYVLARPEHVFAVPESLPAELCALLLFGMQSVQVASSVDGPVAVSGDGVLARLVSSVLKAEGKTPADEASVWVETGAGGAPRAHGCELVLGLSVGLAELRRIWPRARVHRALDAHDLVADTSRIIDLFYDDGEPDWPDWLHPDRARRYLELVEAGAIELGPLPRVDLTQERRSGRMVSGGPGIVLTDFGTSSEPPQRRPLRTGNGRPAVKRVSVVGGGEWPLGMILRQIQRDERIALRGVCDRRPEILNLARQALPFEFATTSYDDLLDDADTDMIVVAPYHGFHAPLAAAALRAGKHCFVEKPPAIDREQLRELVAAAEGSERFLYVGYNRRFAPATAMLLDHLGAIGGPMTMSVIVHSVPLPENHWYFWPSNGNRIISNTCHFIDYALQLTLDGLPVKVTATPSERDRVDKNIVIAISFDDGSLASITYTSRGSDRGGIYYQSYHVMKGDLTASIEDFERLTIHRGGKRVRGWSGALDIGHRRQMALVAERLVSGGPAPVPLEATAISAMTVLAAAESAASGDPVELDFSHGVEHGPSVVLESAANPGRSSG